MKKRIWIVALLALMMTLVSSSALAACGYAWTDGGVQYTCTETSHRIESDWSASTVEDKCIRYLYHYDANQNEELEQRLVAADHNMQFQENDVEPTCQTTGSARYTCTTCGYPSITNVPRAEHVYSPNGQVTLEEATCQQPALVRQSCVYGCGTSQDVRYGSALSSHKTATRVGKEATCGEEGYYVDYCAWCQKELGKGDTIPATGKHRFNTVFDASKSKYPTCIADGVKIYACMDCPELKAEVWPCDPDGAYHSWTGKTQQPTCTEDGMTGDACRYCGKWHASAKVLPAPGHQYGTKVSFQASTCDAPGLKTRICTVCGYVEETIIEPKGCQFEAVVVPCDASSRGYSVEACVRCPAERNKVLHVDTYAETVVNPSGCDNDGLAYMRCSDCDAQLSSVEVPAPGHKWNQTYRLVYDCTKGGTIEGYICKVCGETDQKRIVYDKHDTVDVSEVPATCTEPGRSAGVKCSVCSLVLSGMEEIPALGHDSGLTEEKIVEIQNILALCVEDSKGTNICIVCGETFIEVIPARGYHEYKLSDQSIAALQYDHGLCFEGGQVEVTCHWCCEKYKDFIPARGYHVIMNKESNKWPYPLYYNEATDEFLIDWNIDPALCTSPYYKNCFLPTSHSIHCTCDKEWYVTIPAAGKHINLKGTNEGFCPTCGECEHLTADYLSNPIHVVVQEPTCTEDGIQRHICNQKISLDANLIWGDYEPYCTYSFEEPLYSTGHTWGELREGIAVCIVCGITGERGSSVVCTDEHTPIDNDTDIGIVMCSVCGEKLRDKDFAIDCYHRRDDEKGSKVVFVSTDAYIEDICRYCGDAYLVSMIPLEFYPGSDDVHNQSPRVGCMHDELILVTEKLPTATEEGSYHIECMSCGCSLEPVIIPALGE